LHCRIDRQTGIRFIGGGNPGSMRMIEKSNEYEREDSERYASWQGWMENKSCLVRTGRGA
jgi:hypothetical protein